MISMTFKSRNKFLVLSLIAMVVMAKSIPARAVCGDVSGDGLILSNDVLMVARASIGTLTLTSEQTARADVSISGMPDGLILSNDLLIVARASIGTITNIICNTAGKHIAGTLNLPSNVSLGRSVGRAITPAGLVAKSGVPLEVYRVDSAGNKTGIDYATGATDANGAFEITLPAGVDSANNLVIAAGSGQNLARAIVTSTIVDVSPLSELVLSKVFGGGSASTNFTLDEIDSMTSVVKGDAKDIDLSTAGSVAQALSALYTGALATDLNNAVASFGSSSGNSLVTDETAATNLITQLYTNANAKNFAGFDAYISDSYLNKGESKADFLGQVAQISQCSVFQMNCTVTSLKISGDIATVMVEGTQTQTCGGSTDTSDCHDYYSQTPDWVLRKESGSWKIYGNQEKYDVSARVSTFGSLSNASINVSVSDKNGTVTSASATGSGLTGALSLTGQANDGGGKNWYNNGNNSINFATATFPLRYTITVADGNGTYTYKREIGSVMNAFPTVTSPAETENVTSAPTFTWTAVSSPQFSGAYSVQIQEENTYNGGWSATTKDTHLTYTGPALTAGKRYTANIAAYDSEGNMIYANQRNFRYQKPLGDLNDLCATNADCNSGAGLVCGTGAPKLCQQ